MKKITVKILTRAATLNPQDHAVLQALHQLGIAQVTSVLVGRFIAIELGNKANPEEMKARLPADLKKPQLAAHFNPITDTCEIA